MDWKQIDFEIYRGDSFQGIIESPEKALLIAILIRSRLRSALVGRNDNIGLENLWDARISIGVGSVEYQSEKIIESDGEAFQYSGKNLDLMKKSGDRLRILTPWEELNEEFDVTCKLIDGIIGKWSQISAQTAYYYFLTNKKQEQLAKQFNISQPAVHKRMITAHIEAIALYIQRFEKIILAKHGK